MSTYDPIRKSGVAEEISARLLTMIREKQLHPGEKLPSERELAAMLQVSRPSLREALRALAIMNIIEIRQGDGTYVTSLEPDLLVEHLDFVVSLDDATILQLFEARKIVEVGAASLAAKNISKEQIKALEDCLAKSIESIHDPQEFLAIDLELHERILEAANNPFIKRFLASLSRIGSASRSRTVDIPGIREITARDHGVIVSAIKAHDEDAAADAMLAHLNHVEERLIELINQDESALD
jgi:GntR family transcriptional repressor for pyruvate dehydrogenase complex